jgi:uncharacterized glyoxalase superfamily protein PhnB
MNAEIPSVHSTVPVICSVDIHKSISYYVQVLGFSPDFEYGDPVVYAGVRSGEAEIYFTTDDEMCDLLKERDVHPEIFVWLPDAESSYKTHVANGAEVIEPISERPWGARQYVVRDINGYHLKFAQSV